jgi:anthranilate synthase component I
MLTPDRETFLRQAREGLHIPVYRDILSDFETPLSAYWKLAHDETFSFLLESVTGGEQLARYSILGARPRLTLRTKNRRVMRIGPSGSVPEELPEGTDPLHLLEAELDKVRAKRIPGMPKFVGGAVGMLGYDLVRFFERLPDSTQDDLQVDDLAMMLAETIVVFDHARNLVRVVVNAEPSPGGYDRAQEEIERVVARLRSPLPPIPGAVQEPRPVAANRDAQDFQEAVQKTIRYISQGDCIQTVLSQRFETDTDAHPLTVYRALRSLNPSPYMFLLRLGEFDVIGASPEILVGLEGDAARVRPIAGTRKRGDNEQEDARLADELLADEKERAEHIMLVDLGRNDLGRVCRYGSVEVNDLMVIERYSHVMHIVSDVKGTLDPKRSGMDLVRATFPAGTVSGAPKVRAMQIIDELEPTRRGLYAGSVGYFSATGDLDLCIAIRTILMKGGKAFVQAGAGIVYDSVPEREHEECRNKAAACLRALDLAAQGL